MAYLVDGEKNFSTTVTIANGATTSGLAVIPDDCVFTHIFTPAAVTGTALTITASPTQAGTFAALTDAKGNDITLTMAASKVLGLDPIGDRVYGLKYIKLVSGSTEGAARVFTLYFSPKL